MSVKSRLLTAFCVVSLVAFACATSQQPGGTQPGGSSSVEELPEENKPAAGAATPAAPAGPQLQTVGGPEEGFTAKMPGAPQPQRNKVTIPAGDIVTAAWNANVENVGYAISLADYPVKVVAARPPEAFLNEARDGIIAQLKGTLKSEENITINDTYPGKAFVVSSENGEVKARSYLVGPRLYTMLALYNPSIGAPAADEFLRSLTLINPPPPVERKATRTRSTDGGTTSPTDAGTPATDAGTP
ncbi:hypothetical protein [Hyalangium rubrum]|uniref:Lipoprotein n=1 Tax=Hyalangium rubrum TaxID=3103134 RepID=A0ABU5H2H6_9BACT|nr:hypothetical protein [Hyalangium sp. s54d21]MDY7227663.1 hypothetical protein [Hyalangium sp. s54d21]